MINLQVGGGFAPGAGFTSWRWPRWSIFPDRRCPAGGGRDALRRRVLAVGSFAKDLAHRLQEEKVAPHDRFMHAEFLVKMINAVLQEALSARVVPGNVGSFQAMY